MQAQTGLMRVRQHFGQGVERGETAPAVPASHLAATFGELGGPHTENGQAGRALGMHSFDYDGDGYARTLSDCLQEVTRQTDPAVAFFAFERATPGEERRGDLFRLAGQYTRQRDGRAGFAPGDDVGSAFD